MNEHARGTCRCLFYLIITSSRAFSHTTICVICRKWAFEKFPRTKKCLHPRRDSNPRPLDQKSSALSPALRGHNFTAHYLVTYSSPKFIVGLFPLSKQLSFCQSYYWQKSSLQTIGKLMHFVFSSSTVKTQMHVEFDMQLIFNEPSSGTFNSSKFA